MLFALLALSACTSSDSVSTSSDEDVSNDLTLSDRVMSLQELDVATLAKLDERYAGVVGTLDDRVALVYFSGPDAGVLEISGFGMDSAYQGVFVAKDISPLWQSTAPDGDFLLSVSAGSMPGKLTLDGGIIMSGKNDVSPSRFSYLAAEFNNNHPRAVTLFRGWQPVHLNNLPNAHHVLVTTLDRSIMLIGVVPGSVVELGLVRESKDHSGADALDEPTFDIGELRACTVTQDGFSSLTWPSCRLLPK